MVPLIVTAHLQQGVVLDTLFGTALDGLLTSVIRERHKATRSAATGTLVTGSLLDGGLARDQPAVVDLPLARCEPAGTDTPARDHTGEWHWMATTAYPLDPHGLLAAGDPDVHHHHARLRERVAEQVATKMPASVPPSSGRYRLRRMPVVTTPASTLAWRAVGDPDTIRDLLTGIPALGARRGTGEGTVLAWTITPEPDGNPLTYGHCHPDGSLGRPAPSACVEQLGLSVDRTGRAGIRPPYWHHATQRTVVLPEPLTTREEQ